MSGVSFVQKAADNMEDTPTTKLRILSDHFLNDLQLFNADCCYQKMRGETDYSGTQKAGQNIAPFNS